MSQGVSTRSTHGAGAEAETEREAARDTAQTLLDSDQTLSAADQTASDAEGRDAEVEQIASSSDQALADSDQNASDRDQAAADHALADSPPGKERQRRYEASKTERKLASVERAATRCR